MVIIDYQIYIPYTNTWLLVTDLQGNTLQKKQLHPAQGQIVITPLQLQPALYYVLLLTDGNVIAQSQLFVIK